MHRFRRQGKFLQQWEDILNKISAVIDGEVIVEDDLFYVIKKDGRKVDFSLEAEGLRKRGKA